MQTDGKQLVHDFWQTQSCGEVYAAGTDERDRLRAQAIIRYEIEPYLKPFARFSDGAGREVLEIGVGMGADHLEWAKSGPSRLVGVDLTQRAVDFTTERLLLEGFRPNVQSADAEQLPFAEGTFDIVYSWGVLHHSPNTQAAINEVWRVLRPGGSARIMIYHTHSLVAYMLWLRYGLLRGKWISLKEVYDKYVESPGTKAYTRNEARELCKKFSKVDVKIQLSCGDLLLGAAGQRHRGALLSAAKLLWPRWLIRSCLKGFGTFLLIDTQK